MGDTNVHAVILAGGKGTRFWPLSRAKRPKQLLPIVSERTMVQETVGRLDPLIPADRTWIVTGTDHAAAIREQLPGLPGNHLVVEPVGRNTAPAIGLAARLIAKEDPEATLVVLPADHHIGDPARFREVLAGAVELAARDDLLVTIGIEPDGPETGYGYIERGDEFGSGAWRVARFTEKPDRTTARAFIESGNFYWNAGIFVWRASVILEAFRRHLGAMDEALARIVDAWGDEEAFRTGYEAIAGESVDYGILERADNVAVVPGSFGWDDIGSWTALLRLGTRDIDGNVTRGEVVTIDAKNNLVVTGGRTVALVGVTDLVVVETDDAILVAPADRVQDVRKVTEELAKRGRDDLL